MGRRVKLLKDYLHLPSRARLKQGAYYCLPLEIVRDLLEAEVAHWEDQEPKDQKILKRIYAAAHQTEHAIARERRRKG